ncbi:Sugar ABC transporter substrate-binding protein [Pararobbsia alpina]|uniref:sugar ABC transporter substrate-binding protein n=1 Tax=Pararobbsia alpina TaxID=621374 RepID=UPI0039A77AE2
MQPTYSAWLGRLVPTFLCCVATSTALADTTTIGFVTHSQGDAFIQQIIDGAQSAAKDLGVTLKVAQQSGSAPDGQLKLVQNIVNAGAAGVATSVPGESMTRGLNDIVSSGVPVAQYNLIGANVKAPYVGERSTESGRILGKMIVEKLGGAGAKGKVVIGNCFPGLASLENRAKGVEESLKAAPGLQVLGPYDVKVSAVENYNHWEQLHAANPDAVAMIGLCAPDVASLGKLNASTGDKFIAGGYDLTEQNLKAVKEGHAYVTLGQSAYVQGYLPVALLVNAIRNKTTLQAGFMDAGTQIVTAQSVDMGNGLPKITFEQLQAMSASPAATAEYYKNWAKTVDDPSVLKRLSPISTEGK